MVPPFLSLPKKQLVTLIRLDKGVQPENILKPRTINGMVFQSDQEEENSRIRTHP